jgi:hypothetical protein
LQKLDPEVQLDCTKVEDYRIRFGKGEALSKETVQVKILLKQITFYIILANTPFLYYIQDINKMGVKLDNLKNILIQSTKSILIV